MITTTERSHAVVMGGVTYRDTSVPRMGLTEEPTRVWEIGEPAPLEVPQPCHEPALPELEPASV